MFARYQGMSYTPSHMVLRDHILGCVLSGRAERSESLSRDDLECGHMQFRPPPVQSPPHAQSLYTRTVGQTQSWRRRPVIFWFPRPGDSYNMQLTRQIPFFVRNSLLPYQLRHHQPTLSLKLSQFTPEPVTLASQRTL